jgi:hypothetical protein
MATAETGNIGANAGKRKNEEDDTATAAAASGIGAEPPKKVFRHIDGSSEESESEQDVDNSDAEDASDVRGMSWF